MLKPSHASTYLLRQQAVPKSQFPLIVHNIQVPDLTSWKLKLDPPEIRIRLCPRPNKPATQILVGDHRTRQALLNSAHSTFRRSRSLSQPRLLPPCRIASSADHRSKEATPLLLAQLDRVLLRPTTPDTESNAREKRALASRVGPWTMTTFSPKAAPDKQIDSTSSGRPLTQSFGIAQAAIPRKRPGFPRSNWRKSSLKEQPNQLEC